MSFYLYDTISSCLLNEKFKICQFKLDYNILVLILIIYGRLYMQEKKPRKSTIIKVIPQLCSMLFQLY